MPACTDGRFDAFYGRCFCDVSDAAPALSHYVQSQDKCTVQPACENGIWNLEWNYCSCWENPMTPMYNTVTGNCEAGACPTGIAWIVKDGQGTCDCESGTFWNQSTCAPIPDCGGDIAVANWNDTHNYCECVAPESNFNEDDKQCVAW